MCVCACDAEQALQGEFPHLCINSLIDPIAHRIQHLSGRDKDGGTEREGGSVCLGGGQTGIEKECNKSELNIKKKERERERQRGREQEAKAIWSCPGKMYDMKL